LRQLGLEHYADVFVKNDVDLDAIGLLSDNDLAELGISLGHRRKLLKAIADRNEGVAAATSSATVKGTTSPTVVEGATATADVTGERCQLTVMFCNMVGPVEMSQQFAKNASSGMMGSRMLGTRRGNWGRRSCYPSFYIEGMAP
jgi:hypothetical protein